MNEAKVCQLLALINKMQPGKDAKRPELQIVSQSTEVAPPPRKPPLREGSVRRPGERRSISDHG
jgi:hypothetical protein